MTKRLPFIQELRMEAVGYEFPIELPEISKIIKGDELLMVVFLAKCEEIYHRNAVTSEDVMYIMTSFGVGMLIHHNHLCIHDGDRKFAQVPLPLSVTAGDVVSLIKQHTEI